ncbi:hypothetical protein LR48_Vigan45s003800 [Vigna angularis]|uniref:Uncharacterized protein n=1 Tax=Phaseolus angularis TaxID=3914 RepID=A0A0L9T3X1_PHAAN|nr:hypothetical protein LR48_Vigan45s003800 [Vigna angularis]
MHRASLKRPLRGARARRSSGCFLACSVLAVWFRAGMVSSLGKRVKTLGKKDKGTKGKEKEHFYSVKFRTAAHERYFPAVEGRKLLMETKVIADEIQRCTHGASENAPLRHPSLITHLFEAAHIDVSRPPLERPRKELDAAYFTHYCAVDEPGHPTPPPQQSRAHKREDFVARVAWPADPAQEGGRAEAAEASAMDAKDEDDEDEEAEEDEDSYEMSDELYLASTNGCHLCLE